MKSTRQLFTITLFLIGFHSIILGIFIYFKTNTFYQLFFNSDVTNLFFVKQSGLFLFLFGVFYLYPLTNIDKLYNISITILFSKVLAVIFLLSNANATPFPLIIYIAAAGDGIMAIILLITFMKFKRANKKLMNL